jgi:hypothetical protein
MRLLAAPSVLWCALQEARIGQQSRVEAAGHGCGGSCVHSCIPNVKNKVWRKMMYCGTLYIANSLLDRRHSIGIYTDIDVFLSACNKVYTQISMFMCVSVYTKLDLPCIN